MQRSPSTLVACGAALLALAGCSFSADLPAGHTISCANGERCPSGYTCRADIGQCLSVAQLNEPAATITNATISPTIGKRDTTFTATFSVSAPLAQKPTVYAATLAGNAQTSPFTCTACDPTTTCTCTFTPASASPAPPEGPLEVWISVVDRVGNAPPAVSAGDIQLDFTPPALSHPAELTLIAPSTATTPITELGPGVTAEVCFGVDETLAATPAVWAGADEESGVPFALEGGYPLGLRYCFLSPDGGLPDGPTTLSSAFADLAGNPTQVELIDADGGLVVDLTPPAPPDQSASTGLVYHRAPWGELPTLGVPRFLLSSTGPAIPKAGTLIAYADANRVEEVGRGPVTAGALSPPLSLFGPDRPAVWVDLIDHGGNYAPGGPFLVHHEEWVATLGNKIAGDTLANPNDCYARQVFEPTLVEGDDSNAALGAAAAASTTFGGAGTWWEQQPGFVANIITVEGEYGVWQTALPTVYDSARGRLVSLAGFTFSGRNATWEYDGYWHQVNLSGSSPSSRVASSMSYDAFRGRTVLFGGSQYEEVDDCDTWEWDGQTWRLTIPCTEVPGPMPSDPSVPMPRERAAQAYDRDRRETVMLFGVDSAGNLLDDAWTYDGARWAPMGLDAGAPPARHEAGMGYVTWSDGGAGLLLVGGQIDTSGNENPTNDTWYGVWNGTTYAWTLLSSGASAQPPAADCVQLQIVDQPLPGGDVAMASWDGNDKVVLWTWSGTGWAQRTTLASDDLFFFAATPGSLDGEVYVVGGDVDDVRLQWSCDSSFHCVIGHTEDGEVSPNVGPSALAMDGRGGGVLYGITYLPDAGPYSQPTFWNGYDWIPDVEDGGLEPPPCSSGGFAVDPAADRYYLANTEDDSLWSYARATGWRQEAANLPLGGDGGTAAFDQNPVNLAWVPDAGAWSGLVLDDTTVFGSPFFVRLQPESDGGWQVIPLPIPPDDGTLYYDGTHDQLDVITEAGDVYSLQVGETNDWQSLLRDGGSAGAPLAYDTGVGQLAFIYLNPDNGTGGVAVVDSTGERVVPLADPEGDGVLQSSLFGSMAYDAARERFLFYGGPGNNWELDHDALRPGLACAFRFAYADSNTAVFDAIRVQADANADAGAELVLWEAGQWLATPCDGGCPNTGTLAYTTTDPRQMEVMLSDLGTLGVGVRTQQVNGAGEQQLTAGNVQAQLSFHLP